MNALTITDLSTSIDLDRESMAEIHGGRMKLIGQLNNGTILTSADGEPVSVYVDGSLQNSTRDGYYHL
jgi:predicted membrane-bound spermidine synthase